jgi:hypothetical protein
MFGPKTYREWVNAGWPGAYYEGVWKTGENMRFIGDNGKGWNVGKPGRSA